MSNKKNDYYRQFSEYLLRYLLVLVAPMLLLIIIIFGYNLKSLEEKILQDYKFNLTRVQNDLEIQLDRIIHTAFQISSLPEFENLQKEDNIKSRLDLIKTLNYYESASDIYSLLLYIRSGNILYNSSGTFLLSEIMSSDYFFPDWNKNDFFSNINTSEKREIIGPKKENIHALNSDRFIPYLVSLPMFDGDFRGTLISRIHLNKVTKLLKQVYTENAGAIFLVDRSGTIISPVYLPEGETELDYANFLSTKNDPRFISNDSVNGYYYLSIKSSDSDLSFVSIVHKKLLFGSFYRTRVRIVIWVIGILLLSAVVLFFVARWHYRPLYNLISFVESSTENTYKSGNEISFISNGFNEILKIEEQLKKNQYRSKLALADSLLKGFVKGGYTHLQDFNLEAAETGVHFSNSYFFTGIVRVENFPGFPGSEIIEQFAIQSSQELEIFGEESMENNKIILIFAAKSKNLSDIRTTLFRIMNEIIKDKKIDLSIGCGEIYEDPSQIYKSYLSASMALEYNLTKNKQLTFSSEIALLSERKVNYPSENLKTFDIALFRGDSEEINKQVDFFIQFLTNDTIPLLIVQSLKCDLIMIINKHSRIAEFTDFIPINDIKDPNEFRIIVQDLSIRICSFVNKKEQNKKNRKLKEMYDYLNSNYLDKNFSLQSMADNFDMSVSGLSHYFRKYAPENISIFVQKKRLEKSKELLLTTDLRMQEIAEAVGYTNRTSFMKKFKNMTNLTPGEFREQPR